jgi:DNA ligase (NAD+)
MISPLEAKILSKSLFDDGFDEYPLSDIFSVLEVADDLYYNDDESFLSNTEYDILYQYTKLSDPTNPYFLGVGSSLRGGKVDLPYQMGSLDQIFNGEMQAFIGKNTLSALYAVASDKLDGASGMIVYAQTGEFQIGYSRGNGIQGADISRHLTQMSSVPQKIDISEPMTVRGENIISKTNFPKAQFAKTRSGKPYKNARNMVSGLMNATSNPVQVYQYVDFVAYEIVGSTLSKQEQLDLLKKLGFKTPHYEVVPFSTMNDEMLTSMLELRRTFTEYEIDGLVIEVDSAEKRSEMNPTRSTLNPAYAIKYKVADASNIAIVTVVDVEINVSKDGYLKPRVEIRPVDLVGVTVTWATGFNMKFIRDNKIGPGAKIKITRSGDVVPLILEVIEPMPDY